jgi:chemotaxis response regulator CheB
VRVGASGNDAGEQPREAGVQRGPVEQPDRTGSYVARAYDGVAIAASAGGMTALTQIRS